MLPPNLLWKFKKCFGLYRTNILQAYAMIEDHLQDPPCLPLAEPKDDSTNDDEVKVADENPDQAEKADIAIKVQCVDGGKAAGGEQKSKSNEYDAEMREIMAWMEKEMNEMSLQKYQSTQL